MPEGPEIRQSTDALHRVLSGRQVRRLSFEQAPLKRKAKQLVGQTILAVEPRGKAVLTHFSNQLTIYSHNQLYGQWEVFARGQEPPTHKLRRIVIQTDAHDAVLYSASDIAVLPSAEVGAHPYVAKLGIELLDPATKLQQVRAVVEEPRWQNKALAPLLLDQGFLAGIGNYLRSEILFVARISPDAMLKLLTPAQKQTLAKAALTVTRQAYRLFGITNAPARARALKAQGMSFDRYRHWVFDRGGEACWECRTEIERVMMAGRQLYWCPHCQAN